MVAKCHFPLLSLRGSLGHPRTMEVAEFDAAQVCPSVKFVLGNLTVSQGHTESTATMFGAVHFIRALTTCTVEFEGGILQAR